MKGRYLFVTCCLAFSITLALIIGRRLAAETLAALVGVGVGMVAGLPAGLLVSWAFTRQNNQRLESKAPQIGPGWEPAKTVLMPALPDIACERINASPHAYIQPAGAFAPRRFVIIGDAGEVQPSDIQPHITDRWNTAE